MAEEETTGSSDYSTYKSQRDAYLKAYLDGVEKKIAQRAQELAEKEFGHEARQTPEIRHLVQASLDIAPGSVFPKTDASNSWWQGILSSITGITIVSGILTIIFGGFGLFGPENNTQGFLNVAKIFAGAAVGSAGEAAVTQRRGS